MTPTADAPADRPEKPLPRRAYLRHLHRVFGVALALAGVWVSADLFRLSIGASATLPLLNQFCNPAAKSGDVSAASDCMSVLGSRFARTGGDSGDAKASDEPVGIPWALVGVGYFAAVGLWFLFVGVPDRRAWGWQVPLMIVLGIGAAASIDLLGVMANVLHRWCVGCTIAHGVNFAIALLVLSGVFFGPRSKPGSPAHPGPNLAMATLLAGMLAFALALIGGVSILNRAQTQRLTQRYIEIVSDAQYLAWDYQRQPQHEIPIRPDDVIYGPADAPHTLVVFADFQCGRCRVAAEKLPELIAKHAGQVRLVYRHFPQDPACNPAFPVGHAQSCAAARAAEAARVIGGPDAYREARKLLYENQAQLDSAPFGRIAGELGLERQPFVTAMSCRAVKERLDEDIALGRKIGVVGVPMVFLDGKRFDGWQNTDAWNALIGQGTSSAPATARRN